ncbi:MAG: hypothetical protein ACT4TC_18820 [Myxococcaceae bacterium]
MRNDTQPTLGNWKPAKQKRGPKPNGFLRALSIVVQRGHEISEGAPQGLVLAPRYEARPAPASFAEARRAPARVAAKEFPAAKASAPAVRAPAKTTAPAQQATLRLAVIPSTCGERECPRCHRVGWIDTDFGTRIIRGEVKPQSWCRACRRNGSRQETAGPQLDLLAASH